MGSSREELQASLDSMEGNEEEGEDIEVGLVVTVPDLVGLDHRNHSLDGFFF